MTATRDNLPSVLASLERRVSSLERRLAWNQGDRPTVADQVIEKEFTPAGSLVAVTPVGRRYYPWTTVTLYEVLVSLDTAGSTTTTVKVYVSGGLQGTINLASGVHVAKLAFDNVLQPDADYVQVEVSTAGTGAKDLTVQARMTRSA